MVMDNAKSNNLAALLAKDQLLDQMLLGKVFEGYKEGLELVPLCIFLNSIIQLIIYTEGQFLCSRFHQISTNL